MLSLWTKFQCHSFFPSQDIKKNVTQRIQVLILTIHISDHCLKQQPTGRK